MNRRVRGWWAAHDEFADLETFDLGASGREPADGEPADSESSDGKRSDGARTDDAGKSWRSHRRHADGSRAFLHEDVPQTGERGARTRLEPRRPAPSLADT